MKNGLLYFLLCLAALVSSCDGTNTRYHIGVSQCSDDEWRHKMNKEMQREALFYDGVQVEFRTAKDNNQYQINDINYFIDRKVDLLIVAPNEAAVITPSVEKAIKKGIPVVVVDRKILSDNYTAFVGADNYKIGSDVGHYIVSRLNGKGNIFEVTGLQGSTPAMERHRGLMDALAGIPNIKRVGSVDGGWLQSQAGEKVDSVLRVHKDIDLLFAQNDRMAIGAYLAARQQGREKEMLFVGVDALPGKDYGLEQVISGVLDATFIYPTGGDKVMQIAMNILEKRPFEKENILSTALVDKTNARVMQLQTDHILEQDGKIEKLNGQIDEFWSRYSAQTMFLYACLVILILFAALLGIIVRAYWMKNRMNAELSSQKKKLEEQRDQLISLSKQLEEATHAKLVFFTNVSHDFRTPLTLVAAPVEQLLEDEALTSRQRSLLQMVHKNVTILLRLVNQILDFRKIQNGKMRLHVSLFNLNEMVDSFEKEFRVMAEENEVSFTFQLAGEDIMVWADKEKVAIVIRNIISNAFKFTPAGGNIYVTMGVSDDDRHCYVRVEDSGVGIPQSKLSEIFERFSQADNARGAYYQGTGIGLALSKEIISLHHGEIYAESPEGKGAVFTIELQLGKEHYKPSEVDFYMGGETVSVPEAESVSASAGKESEEEKEQPVDSSLPTVLIVEDNKDLCNMLKLQLEDKFNIYMANDGVEGLKKVHLYHPDMVVTDQMMPNMDGIEMLQRIRKDFQISHIPVIILTAKGNDEAKTKAISMGANAYIIKPFSKDYLVARIEQLLNERKLFRERVWQQPEEHKEEQDTYEQFLVKKDVQFIEKIHQVIEENLDNSDFNIDTIASTIGLSRSAFFKKLKSLTGFAPVDLVKEIRLNKSIELIKNSDMSISEIAFAVGFKDSGYFSKCFRKKYDQTPREYMNEWRKG